MGEISREQVVEDYSPLVKQIALKLCSRLGDHSLVDDFYQAGVIGLLEAQKRFDRQQGASFATYAGIRIKGAMVDELRRGSWTPRSVSKLNREISASIAVLEQRLGRPAKESEIAANVGMSLDQYQRALNDCMAVQLESFDQLLELNDSAFDAEDISDPAAQFMVKATRESLNSGIAKLPKREALIMQLYFLEELQLREIGEILEISESRVSQILTQASMRLKALVANNVH